MKKLKIAILWHQHQPYYKYKNEFLLPWVRFHGIKDYYDLPALLCQYTKVKQTFNIVPSLILQIEDYINDVTYDKIQRLTRIRANELSNNDKIDILNNFFILNHDNLLFPFKRYRELFDRSKNREVALFEFTVQDWLDIQVLYNLAWIGPISKKNPLIDRLIKKGSNFTEVEKNLLLELHKKILEKIVPLMSNLKKLGQIEISCSPMFHPILPLIIDSRVALEAMPYTELPNPIYRYPEDAKDQLEMGTNYYKSLFGEKPNGMWPSEGAISNETLKLLIESGINWTATDEEVLINSIGKDYKPTFKYFPYKYELKNNEFEKNKEITLFFRDHQLSDKIGFLYSKWNPFDAACDFRENLFNIRNEIIRVHSEDALDSAVVPIILDGENCWEFYPENGTYFLNEFFKMLSYTEEFETVLFSDCLHQITPSYIPKLNNIKAGSWINSNFSIWIGHKDDIKAWNILSKIRAEIDKEKSKLSSEKIKEIMQEIYIAEGSDWFWWYGPEHEAEHKADFDVIFRWRISEIYKKLGLEIPQELFNPIGNTISNNNIKPLENITPDINGDISIKTPWDKAGIFYCNTCMSTMHQIGELISSIKYGCDDKWIYFRIELINKLSGDEKIIFTINDIKLTYENFVVCVSSNKNINFKFAVKDAIDFAISRSNVSEVIYFYIKTNSASKEIRYPFENTFIFNTKKFSN